MTWIQLGFIQNGIQLKQSIHLENLSAKLGFQFTSNLLSYNENWSNITDPRPPPVDLLRDHRESHVDYVLEDAGAIAACPRHQLHGRRSEGSMPTCSSPLPGAGCAAPDAHCSSDRSQSICRLTRQGKARDPHSSSQRRKERERERLFLNKNKRTTLSSKHAGLTWLTSYVQFQIENINTISRFLTESMGLQII